MSQQTLTLRFRLRSPQLLQTIREHTGDGTRATTRELAELANVHPSFIGKLLKGEQETVTAKVAFAISGRCGVDLLVLWSPVQRTAAAATQVEAVAS
ncbi:helix-turn-helix domain-containing protein [Kitasatospora cineracea]